MSELVQRCASSLLVVTLGLLLACASQRTAPPLEEAPMEQAEYVIGAGDDLRIVVWKNPELSGDVPVRTDGMISVPLIDDIRAEGLTPTQLKQQIVDGLAEYITAPDVTVVVVKPNSKRVYVIGEVVRSGPIPMLQDLRITDAVAAAGGFGPFANKGRVRVIRRSGREEEEFVFDYDAYVKGRAPGTNIVLRPGDTVVVPD